MQSNFTPCNSVPTQQCKHPKRELLSFHVCRTIILNSALFLLETDMNQPSSWKAWRLAQTHRHICVPWRGFEMRKPKPSSPPSVQSLTYICLKKLRMETRSQCKPLLLQHWKLPERATSSAVANSSNCQRPHLRIEQRLGRRANSLC